MKSTVNLKPALAFLDGLAQNNNKAWFDANRDRYVAARASFEEFVQLLISAIDKFDPLGGLAARDCIFRLNRDLRFSKDKTPYKTNFGALIAPGGKKSARQGYYFQLMPHDKSGAAGGLYMPSPAQLAAFRRAIDRDPAPFQKIINARPFLRLFGPLQGTKLTTAPRGYAPDHPAIELLKLKDVTVWRAFSDPEVVAPDIVSGAARTFKAMQPFLRYLDSTL
jgi:uncharacterized protein (TIGR02453 family)